MMFTSKLLREQYVSKYTPVSSALSTSPAFHSDGEICRITDFTFAA